MLIQSRRIRRHLNVVLRLLNLKLHDNPTDGTRASLGWLRGRYNTRTIIPPQAREELRCDHPALQDLRRRYASSSLPMSTLAVWGTADRLQDLTMRYFRGDNAYLWQLRNIRRQRRQKYRRYADYVRSIDHRGLLHQLEEDGTFGCWTYQDSTQTVVSRDLLDSINEMYFLDRVWGLLDRRDVSVLDIGAGYGRLAHRMVLAVPGLNQYYCLDAVPESTFLCDYYLRYRKLEPRARAVPLDQLDDEIKGPIDLAVNVHSFSEMPIKAIQGWLAWLVERDVPHLFVVSNEGDRLLSLEADFTRSDVLPLLADHGYRLVASEPVIPDDRARRFIGIEDAFLFFARAVNHPETR
jgi:putative sugar O-methyltransferase